MALSKLVIGLVAGVASVIAIGGVTAAVVTSSNRNTVNTVEEEKTENKDLATNTSMSENRSRKDAAIASSNENDSAKTNSEITTDDDDIRRSGDLKTSREIEHNSRKNNDPVTQNDLVDKQDQDELKKSQDQEARQEQTDEDDKQTDPKQAQTPSLSATPETVNKVPEEKPLAAEQKDTGNDDVEIEKAN